MKGSAERHRRIYLGARLYRANEAERDPEPTVFEREVELPAAVRRAVQDAPALIAIEGDDFEGNPDLWSEEYERELLCFGERASLQLLRYTQLRRFAKQRAEYEQRRLRLRLKLPAS